MAWPSSDEFVQAVQNPRTAFHDPELRDAQPELGMWDMPKARSGGFAVVFKLQCMSRNWAVKCFTHDFADQQERYAAISEYLSREHLPYIFGFAFLADGIRIRDRTYPILKMEWVEGESLKDYVTRHLSQPSALRSLAARWAAMVAALQKARIAHGDLQDQNVIVVQGELRLIDYDGMFVPLLAGHGSHELGARHYQHPLRSENDFAPYVDNFSAWVVYLSLVALSVQPDLWQRFGGGDDKLLLSCEDYKEPDTSPALKSAACLPAASHSYS